MQPAAAHQQHDGDRARSSAASDSRPVRREPSSAPEDRAAAPPARDNARRSGAALGRCASDARARRRSTPTVDVRRRPRAAAPRATQRSSAGIAQRAERSARRSAAEQRRSPRRSSTAARDVELAGRRRRRGSGFGGAGAAARSRTAISTAAMHAAAAATPRIAAGERRSTERSPACATTRRRRPRPATEPPVDAAAAARRSATAAIASTAISPGRMNARPADQRAGGRRRARAVDRQLRRGRPGSSWHAAYGVLELARSIQPRALHDSSRSSATCAGGPPKPISPSAPTRAGPSSADAHGGDYLIPHGAAVRRTRGGAARGPQPRDGPLAARMRPRTLDEFVGQEHLLGEGSALRTAIESGRAALDGPVRPARAPARRRSRGSPPSTPTRRSRSSRAVNAGRAEVREVIARARERRRGGRRDDLLPRRDPPLQQGPAGRAAARGRGGPRDADRRDDREPVLRGQLRAALARPGLRAARARRRRRRGAAAARARARRVRRRRGRRRGDRRSSPRARAATRGRR